MTNRKTPLLPVRGARSPRGAGKHADKLIVLAPAEVRALWEILSRDLHLLETEIAGNDWQDLSDSVLAKEEVLRRLVAELSV